MQFLKQPVETGREALTQALIGQLMTGKKVFWLVAGGSNIQTAVAVMNQLRGHEQNLTITLTDERYGEPGHADSNWRQLTDAGFEVGAATTYPVLQADMSLEETTKAFEAFLVQALEQADVVIGQLGMGADGHTAGILAHSPASRAIESLVVGYQTGQYDRVTTTFSALRRLNVAFCFAYGEDKWPAVECLAQTDNSLDEQPAQILKQIPEAYVYNDHIGETKL